MRKIYVKPKVVGKYEALKFPAAIVSIVMALFLEASISFLRAIFSFIM